MGRNNIKKTLLLKTIFYKAKGNRQQILFLDAVGEVACVAEAGHDVRVRG